MEDIASPDGAPPAALPATPASIATCDLYVVSEIEQLALLRDEWTQLLHHARVMSPFMTWEMLYPWYSVHRSDGDVHCLIVEHQDRMVGLAPLFLSRRPDGFLRPGELGFASSFGHSWGFYLDLVAAPGFEAVVADLILQHVLEHRRDWHLVKLGRMQPNSRLLPHLIRSCAASSLPIVVKSGLTTMTSPLPQTAGEFASWVPSSNRRKKSRRMLRRMQQEVGEATLRQCRDEDELDQMIKELIRLSIEQRGSASRRSNFEDPKFTQCFVDSTRLLWKSGWLRCHALNCSGVAAAMSVDLTFGDRLYAMQPAYDPSLASYDPGHLLMTMVVEQAISEGVRELDMLPGGEYKKQYVQPGQPLLQVTLPNESLRGALPVTYDLLRRSVRKGTRRTLDMLLGSRDSNPTMPDAAAEDRDSLTDGTP